MKRITADDSRIKCNGRGSLVNGEFPMFTTGSGIEFNVKASELIVELEADFDAYEPWISVLVDGERVLRTSLNKGINRYLVFRWTNPEDEKHVRITKDVQSMPDDKAHKLVFKAIEIEGELTEIQEKPLKLEFIGDSITSGEGLIGAKKFNDWVSLCFDSVNNYTNLIATKLNADYNVISQSGWGVVCSWDSNPSCTLPSIYEKVCGTCFAQENTKFASMEKHDFSSFEPDAIIINLGTNDCGASAPANLFKKGVYNFLCMLRKNNPKSELLWVYGIIDGDFDVLIKEAMEDYRNDSKDDKVHFMAYEKMTDDMIGSRFHPGLQAHRYMADKTLEKLNELLRK